LNTLFLIVAFLLISRLAPIVSSRLFRRRPLAFVSHSACRRSFVEILSESTTFDPEVIDLVPWDRFGNNVFQFERVLAGSSHLGIYDVYVRRGFLFFNATFTTTHGVIVHQENCPLGGFILRGHFWWLPWSGDCFVVDRPVLSDTFRSEFLKAFRLDRTNRSTLYLHVRGGDIFTTNILSMYAQPPCRYYTEAIDLDGDRHNQVVLIAQDSQNPCLAMLMHKGYSWTPSPLQLDLGLLIYARRTVWSCGTFSQAVIDLAAVRQVYYTFACFQPSPYLDAVHLECRPDAVYMRTVHSTWTKSDQQLQMMMTSRGCFAWNVVRPDRLP
jgi:hypothetical protein